jgi:2-deoxy-D-gluconate 3-dehydrogenase
MESLFDLTGKSAIVTGASTGLGMGMTLGLASAGADVLLVDHVPSDTVAQEVRMLGRKAATLVVDLMQMSSIELSVKKAVAEFGKIDILINNAGIIHRLQRKGLG